MQTKTDDTLANTQKMHKIIGNVAIAREYRRQHVFAEFVVGVVFLFGATDGRT